MDFSYFNKLTCLVTGSCGFIGSHLCNKLKLLGANVYNLDWKDAATHKIDVSNFAELYDAFRDSSIDIVFHLASSTEVIESYTRPYQYYRNNILGGLNILELTRKLDKASRPIKSVVIASSDKAYGNEYRGYPKFKETDTLYNNIDPYSSSKKMLDELSQDYARIYNLPIHVLRACNVYGPGQLNNSTLITNTIESILEDKKPIIHSHCTTVVREWMYVDDVINAYLLLGMINTDFYSPPDDNRRTNGSICFNVGSGEVYCVSKVVSIILKEFGKGEYDYEYNRTVEIPDQTPIQTVDSTKFRTTFPSWQPMLFKDGIKPTIEWYKQEYGKSKS